MTLLSLPPPPSRRPHPAAHAICMQNLDQAGEWESLLSSSGFINSARDYGLHPPAAVGSRATHGSPAGGNAEE